jgi:hypothetical protein
MKMSECEKVGEVSPMMLMQPKGNETRLPLLAVLLRAACTACTTKSHTQLLPLIGLCRENSITKLPINLSPATHSDMHTVVLSKRAASGDKCLAPVPPSRRNF